RGFAASQRVEARYSPSTLTTCRSRETLSLFRPVRLLLLDTKLRFVPPYSPSGPAESLPCVLLRMERETEYRPRRWTSARQILRSVWIRELDAANPGTIGET